MVAQPHYGGIMGVRMGVMLGGVGCMMREMYFLSFECSELDRK